MDALFVRFLLIVSNQFSLPLSVCLVGISSS